MDQHKTNDNLRYVGGLTRVLAADASISFADANDDDFSIAKGAAALDDLTDDDIRMAIQMLMVPFEFLVRRQIARLLDPSLQCLRFVYDELMKISHACEVTELQRFPVLRKHLDEVMVKFFRHGVEPAKRMI
ncbi:dynamin-related protein 3A-like [Prunus persica]|uniref:dynamin-related protein 3A-like n=1 Tax=Prunus persica TaxID=3760 RepID=UPI0009AB3454|nr:dynamin-related protein 3A-like [Prunus persica]